MKKMSRRSSCMTLIVLILLVVPFIGWNTLFAMYTDTGRGMLAKSIFEDLLKSNGISLEITDVNNVRNVGNWEQIKDYVSEDINIKEFDALDRTGKLYLGVGEFRDPKDHSTFQRNICIYQINKHFIEHETYAFGCK